jgi:hypothetical protein
LTTLAGVARVSLPIAQACDRGQVLHVPLVKLLQVANVLDATVADCWPLLGPLPRDATKARRRDIREGIARLDAERARRREALGDLDWSADRDSA